MDIYDSESNPWTRAYTPIPRYVFPHLLGIHSQGKLYWRVLWGESTYRLAVFKTTDNTWKVM
jgi:hypothetical protein